MSDFSLVATPALDGHRSTSHGMVLEELTQLAIVSVSTPLGGEDALAEALQSGFGAKVPPTGRITTSKDSKIRFMGMSPGQIFAVFEHDGADARNRIADVLQKTAYTTDQSDVWVGLRISGPAPEEVLERICPLDLHTDAFPDDAVARTVMEHMAAIILRDGPDGFILLTTRSSARSFLHALEVSIENVL